MSEENQALQQYDDFAIRHNAAMAAFKTMHEARHPLPVKEEISRDVVSLIIIVALAIVMVAAVIVSSSRTIDEFGGGAIGVTAFIMVEGGIMAYAFFRARRNASKTRLQNTIKWATAGLVLTFVVGLGANTDASLKHQGVELPSWVNTAIHLLVAISAPTLAFISSDVLAIELMATDIKRRDAEDNHKSALEDWWTDFNRSWSSNQKNWGVRVEMEQPKQFEAVNSVKSSNLQSNTRFTPSRKLQQALDWFELNPDQLNEESRKLAVKIGVSHTTVNKAQRMIRGGE